ncbi:MAG: N-acetylmuramoyl-L-alanine amidase, partial [Romboutsia sp.]|nr:N-acetylmuramoyl-L-alanine amidase [Romboutsia sp.]
MAKNINRRRVKRYKKRRINKKRLLLLIIVVILFFAGLFKLTQGIILFSQKINNNHTNQSTSVENTDDSSEVLNTEVDKNINKKYTILIDPGHGGNDKGTIAKDKITFEKDITLKIGTLIAQKLTKQNDVQVIVSRNEDKYVS